MLTPSLSAQTLNVPADYSTIQSAIDTAVNGDTILVQPGTYVENINFNGKNIIVASLFLTTADTSYISQTIIDGNQAGRVVIFNSGEDSTALLSGITITNGQGGILCTAAPRLENLIIENNEGISGGGIFFSGSQLRGLITTAANLRNVIIRGNTATSNGGGIYCDNSRPSIVDVKIIENEAKGSGGGIYFSNFVNGGGPRLENVTISRNIAPNGGGIACYWSNSILKNVVIVGNIATRGGGIWTGRSCSPRLVNVTISGNNIFDYGIFPGTRGGIFIGSDSHPVLVNTIVYTPNPEENSPQEIYFDRHSFGSSTVTIAYSAVHGGEAGIKTNNYGIVNWLDGNIDEDPLIVDAESGDVHLYEGSPAIDAGTDFFLLDGDTLLDLKPGDYTGSAPDMGAIETFYTSVRPGDTDNNGTVNEFDVLPIGVYFLYNGSPRQIATFDWSPQSAILWNLNPATYADANGDGIVDERDVIAIGVNWGNTHTNTSASFAINPSDATLLNHHREAFQGIFNSLSGESEAVKAMRALLRPILNIQVPEAFNLHQNYPNPFNPRTTIGFELPEDEIVTLTIYNLLGQVVTVPVDKKRYDAGIHTVHLDAGHFSSGIYFYRVEAGSWSATRKMLVIK